MANEREFWKGAADKAYEKLAELRAERDDLMAQVETLNDQILQWEMIVKSLNPVASGQVKVSAVRVIENISDVSLTEASRAILQQVRELLTAKGIRNILQASGYQPDKKHSNPLASIHGVLKRLAESGEAEQVEAGGKTFYRWNERGIAIGPVRGTITVAQPVGPPELFKKPRKNFLADLAAEVINKDKKN
jgi:hypothetical protein